jgi:hypothetical protein
MSGFLQAETEAGDKSLTLCLCWICVADMGNNPVWKEEIFHIDLNGCSDETLVRIEIYKDESKLIGSLV